MIKCTKFKSNVNFYMFYRSRFVVLKATGTYV